MARGLDHIVHAVHDLDGAAELYRRIGFTVGARNRHPWGTHNYIVQCPGTFIELLTVVEPDKLGADGMSRLFGRYSQDYLARGEGLSLLLLESKNAEADVIDYKAAGIAAVDEPVHFEREAKRPDGTPIKVGFSLAFAQDKAAPLMRFATCQQHYPENFWNPAFQNHANGATEIRSVIMVVDDPEQHRAFASAYTGSTDFYVEPGEVSLWLPRGSFSTMTPTRFQAAFGGPMPAASNHLQAIRFAVADIAAARAITQKSGVKTRDHREGFVIDPPDAMGATLSFEPVKSPR
jgi:catechol 2,3-dioxygenase-like lactoylglutathione lyase family enzyme